MERGWLKAHVEISPTCPRCGSSNTKFCYYNNYSLTQPRYFCKGCRRYWTKGGSLRNIPVGGGCRKARRGKSVRISRHGLSSRISSISGYSRVVANGNFIAESSSNPAPNIDLAVVYANYLNQQPPLDETKQHEMPILMPNASHVDTGNKLLPEIFFNECATGFSDWSMDIHSSKDLLHIRGIEESIGHDDKYRNIVSGSTSHDLISNYDQLLPLPGEEMGIWSSFQANIVNDVTDDQTLHGVQVMLGFEAEADDEQLMGSRSMFDHLPNYGTSNRP